MNYHAGMAWESRNYAYQPPPPTRPAWPRSLTVWLMVGSGLGALLGAALEGASRVPQWAWPVTQGVLGPGDLFGRHEWWRLFTYPWVQSFLQPSADFLSLLFGLMCLWVFGRMAEGCLSRWRCLAIVAAGVLVGGLAVSLVWALAPHLLAGQWLCGPMAMVFALMGVAVACMPRAPIGLMFLPFSFQLRWLVLGFAGLSLVMILAGSSRAALEATNLVSLGTGFVGAKLFERLRTRGGVAASPWAQVQARVRAAREAKVEEDEAAHSAEVDRILAKIAKEGMGKLTKAEKATLRRSTERANGRH